VTPRREALVELVDRIDAADDECSYAVGAAPASDAWHPLGDLLDDTAAVEALIGTLVDGEAAGHRDVAGSYLASWVAGPIVQLVAAAWLDAGWVLHLEHDQVWVRFHEDGWVDGVALADAALAVGADDPVAASTGVQVVGDPEERRRLVAGQIRSVAEPIFDAVRALVPYGRSGMWGSLADGLAGTALHTEQRRAGGGDPAGTWAGVDALIDELVRQVPELRARPRRQLIPWSGGTRHQSVRGTCCLYYKTCTDPDPCGDGYCSSCPHRPDESRALRITRWLEDQPA
jgi:hypothetical protein